jgi:S-adenosylmethionine:tRNA ribosyltransferase-isomerase
MPPDPEDFLLSSYRHDVPAELIAQAPPERRGSSRLMLLEREGGGIRHSRFSSLPEHLPEGALLVFNTSKVVPARLLGRRETGGEREFLLLTPLPLVLESARETGGGRRAAEVEGLARGAGKTPGEVWRFGNLEVTLLDRLPFGGRRALFVWRGDLAAELAREGLPPLPPYIRRPVGEADRERYQTVYAREEGSAAAPTAGLHFTRSMLDGLARRGFGRAEVHLHVGYGTFSPVRRRDIRLHRMHPEYFGISREAAEAVNRAKADGQPVVAVGTTAARALEGCAAACGEVREFRGRTDIFFYPGVRFHVTDGLLTNFHLPESSLLMMVCAFAGREAVLEAYRRAVKDAYRFFSYGDAMLVV